MDPTIQELELICVRCTNDKSRLRYRERMRCERALFRCCKRLAKQRCNYNLQSFCNKSRFAFDEFCNVNRVTGLAHETILLGFEIQSVVKTVCSGNPYHVDGLVDPFINGRHGVLETLVLRIRRLIRNIECLG